MARRAVSGSRQTGCDSGTAGLREGRLAFLEPLLVFGMDRHPPVSGAEHGPHPRVVGHEQRARGRAHEDLHAGAAGRVLESREVARVLSGGAHVERVVAGRAAAGAGELVGQGKGRGGGRNRVGHLEDRGDPPQDGGAGTGREVFLVGEARLAEVHLGVDHAGQDVQTMRVEHFGGGRGPEGAQGDDSAFANPDVARHGPGRPHAGAAPDQKIEAPRCQGLSLLCVPIGFVMN